MTQAACATVFKVGRDLLGSSAVRAFKARRGFHFAVARRRRKRVLFAPQGGAPVPNFSSPPGGRGASRWWSGSGTTGPGVTMIPIAPAGARDVTGSGAQGAMAGHMKFLYGSIRLPFKDERMQAVARILGPGALLIFRFPQFHRRE